MSRMAPGRVIGAMTQRETAIIVERDSDKENNARRAKQRGMCRRTLNFNEVPAFLRSNLVNLSDRSRRVRICVYH